MSTSQEIVSTMQINDKEVSITTDKDNKVTKFIDTLRDSQEEEGLITSELISVVGQDEVMQLSQISEVLKTQKMGDLEKSEGGSGDISTSLMDLRTEVDGLSTTNVNFNEPGWLMNLVYKVIGGTPAQKYLTKYQTAEVVIQDIISSLDDGKLLLKEDNSGFNLDKKRYLAAARSLSEKVELLMIADVRIEERIADETNEYEKSFLQTEVLFPIRQHIGDLQQMVAISQQGGMALDILMSNNTSLITSVSRAVNTTVPLLSICLNIARGLANQKKVLEAVNATNSMASNMLSNNAKMLKQQGAEIQKGATQASIDVQVIQDAINETLSALQDIEDYKVQSLPKMKNAINDLNEVNTKASLKIDAMERKENTTMKELM